MNKRIGIVAWATGANSFGATTPYVDFFSNFGIVELIMPNEIEIRKDLDLLVLPGGPDVDTSRYLDHGTPLSFYIGKTCPFRERFDKVLLPKYIENRTPIFGICRGHQTLAVEFGGKLVQDMWQSGLGHETNGEDRTKLVHSVLVDEKEYTTATNGYTSNKVFDINSIHHQCLDSEFLPKTATILATYSNRSGMIKDGVVEAVTYEPHYPAHTVQWHPEEIRDRFSVNLISNLLKL